jgi:uncharacterized protein (TIGR02001 family)
MKIKHFLVALVTVFGATTLTTHAGAAPSGSSFTGNIGVHSKYVLRGITNDAENDRAALQGGLDWENSNGWYAGWWASSLDYSSDTTAGTVEGNGFENDFYFGKKTKFGNFNLDVGIIQYYYVDVDDSDLTELKLAVSTGPFKVQLQYLLNDGAWGNAGDQYWTINYEKKLPKNFTLGLSYGHYVYDDDDNPDLGQATVIDDGFRHFNITLSHPIGKTGADWYVQYIVAGEDRGGIEHDNTMVFGITYGFNL